MTDTVMRTGPTAGRDTWLIPPGRTVPTMRQILSLPARDALLLVALEPSAPRARVEAALVLLGHRAAALDEAVRVGLVRLNGGRLEATDPRVGRAVVREATERERRTAHLALACAHVGADTRFRSRRAFDSLTATLGDLPPPADPSTGPGSLTPRERTVAALAATGAPVREIAEAVFLSQKTVETHLTRVYRKLGVRSKAELVFAFRTQ